MSVELSSNAQKVQEYLQQRGFDCNVKELPGSTRTAQEAADSIGCSVAQIAKSIIFKNAATDAPVLVIASGENRIDTQKIEQQLNITLGKADGKFVKQRTGFAIGGVPPVAHKEPLLTLLDEDLKAYDAIWAAAGTPFSVFELKPINLPLLTEGQWMDVSEKCDA
ncbi:MAG: YbaK/EbsC family protein [Aestuariibacter sp.]